MAKYYGYARVSTELQHDTSIDVQLQYLRLDAESLGVEFEGFSEKKSGKSIEGRDVLQGVLAMMKPGDILGVYDDSRLSRNTEEFLSLIKKLSGEGKKVRSEAHEIDFNNPTCELTHTMLAGVATFHRKNTGLKCKAGRIQQNLDGDRVFISSLYGYKVWKRKGKHIAEIIPEEGEIIEHLYKLYLSGKTLHAIEREMKDIISDRMTFEASHIAKILKKPIYMGYYVVDSGYKIDFVNGSREDIEKHLVKSNVYPPIVSEDDWWRVFDNWRTKTITNDMQFDRRHSSYELSGILTCGHCGKGYTHHYNKVHNRDSVNVQSLYSCLSHRVRCEEPNYRQYHVDKMNLVFHLLLFLTFSFGIEIASFYEERRLMLSQTVENLERAEKAYEKELETIDKKLDNLVDALLEGVLPKIALNKKSNELKEKRDKKKEDLDKVKNVLDSKKMELEELLREATEQLIEDFTKGTAEERRIIYTKVIESAKVFKDRIEVTFINGKKYILEQFPPKLKTKRIMPFKMYLKGEFQCNGHIDLEGKTIAFDFEPTEDPFKRYAQDVYNPIADNANRLIANLAV